MAEKILGDGMHLRLKPWLLIFILPIILLTVGLVPRYWIFRDTTPPVINVWYGPNQTFGQQGLPQRWVNILGNVADPESGVSRLAYSLNGGPLAPARVGPDDRRLARPGDFNLQIDPASLRDGANTVLIEATNGSGFKATSTVNLTFHHNAITLPYTIDWSTVKNLQDVLQVVDGKWQISPNGIRPVEMGYDRMLAVGDASWTNYEVLVPVTVHGVDPTAFNDKQGGDHAGISVDMRWIGHSDDPVKCSPSPSCGWNPVGDFNKFFFKEDKNNYLGLKLTEKEQNFPPVVYHFDPGDTYFFKADVLTTPQGNEYRFKVWEKGKETEPATWMFDRTIAFDGSPEGNPLHGAFSLVAHHTDVTFGNISVTPLP